MKIMSQHPFLDFNCYLLTSREGRKIVCLINRCKKEQRTTISYAKYLMSIKKGRILRKDEQVDHIDEDKTNDSIENLQILTAKENVGKHLKERKKTRKMVSMECPACNTIFERPLNLTFLQKGGHYNACSRLCSYNILKKGLSISELVDLGQAQVREHYRK